MKKLGIKNVGVAPKGKAAWEVSEKKAEYIAKERARIEGNIGNIKQEKYHFNKIDAKSTASMATYGHRAIVGFNMSKLVKELAMS